MPTVKKNIFWSSLSSVIQIYTGSIIFILFAKLMVISDFGILTFGFSLAGLLSVLADFGHSLMVITEYPKQKNPQQYLSNVVSQKTIFSVVTFLLALLYVLFYDGDAFKVGFLFIIYAIFASFVSYFQALLRIRNNFFLFARIQFVYALLVTILMLFYYFTNISLVELTILLIVCKAIQLISAVISLNKYKLVGFDFNKTIQKELLSKVWTYGLHWVIGTFYFTIDTQIISIYLSDKEVALYQSIFRVILILLMSSDILSSVFLPYLSSKFYKNKEEITNVSNKINLFLIILGLSLFLFFTTFYETIILLLYKPEYLQAKIIIIPLSIVVFLRTTASLFGNLLTISNNQLSRAKTVFITLILSVVVNIIMIPRFGIIGAAWSSVFVHLVLFFCYYLFSKIEFKSLEILNKENIILVALTTFLFVVIRYFGSDNIWIISGAISAWCIAVVIILKNNNNYKFYKEILRERGV